MGLGVVVAVEVDAQGDGDVGVGRRGRDDHLLRPGLEVLGGVVALREQAGRLDHDVDAEVAPGQRRGIALGEHLDRLAVDDDRPVALGDLAREAAEDRVVLEQVGERAHVGDVVDGDELELGPGLVGGPEQVAPDAPEAVDCRPSPSPSALPRGRFSVALHGDLDPVPIRVEQIGRVVVATVLGPWPGRAVVGAAGADAALPRRLDGGEAAGGEADVPGARAAASPRAKAKNTGRTIPQAITWSSSSWRRQPSEPSTAS